MLTRGLVNEHAKLSLVYIPHLQKIVINMIPNKMVAKRKGLFFRVIPGLVTFNTTLMLSKNIDVGLQNLMPICIKVILEHNRLLGSLLQSCQLCTKC